MAASTRSTTACVRWPLVPALPCGGGAAGVAPERGEVRVGQALSKAAVAGVPSVVVAAGMVCRARRGGQDRHRACRLAVPLMFGRGCHSETHACVLHGTAARVRAREDAPQVWEWTHHERAQQATRATHCAGPAPAAHSGALMGRGSAAGRWHGGRQVGVHDTTPSSSGQLAGQGRAELTDYWWPLSSFSPLYTSAAGCCQWYHMPLRTAARLTQRAAGPVIKQLALTRPLRPSFHAVRCH